LQFHFPPFDFQRSDYCGEERCTQPTQAWCDPGHMCWEIMSCAIRDALCPFLKAPAFPGSLENELTLSPSQSDGARTIWERNRERERERACGIKISF